MPTGVNFGGFPGTILDAGHFVQALPGNEICCLTFKTVQADPHETPGLLRRNLCVDELNAERKAHRLTEIPFSRCAYDRLIRRAKKASGNPLLYACTGDV
jgi:hypothetical protein